MNRRTLLPLLASAAFLPGCLSSSEQPTTDNQPSSPEPALTIGDTFETADEKTISLVDVHLRRTAFDSFVPDAVRPHAPQNHQFVFVTLSLGEPDALLPEPESFRLVLDGEAIPGTGTPDGLSVDTNLAMPNDAVFPTPKTAVESGVDTATIAFLAPLDVSADRVAVEWHGEEESATWTWDDNLVDALATPPVFEVRNVEFPDVFHCEEPFDITATVANEGKREGVFNGISQLTAPARDEHPPSVSLTVPAGETETWKQRLTYPPRLSGQDCDPDAEQATITLDWGTGERTITLDRG